MIQFNSDVIKDGIILWKSPKDVRRKTSGTQCNPGSDGKAEVEGGKSHK